MNETIGAETLLDDLIESLREVVSETVDASEINTITLQVAMNAAPEHMLVIAEALKTNPVADAQALEMLRESIAVSMSDAETARLRDRLYDTFEV